ncbi:MAG: hypothetical protein R3344_06430 [Acidobacteriota bacterium]|nr:hypothetical protein [Acidobacteriota bacterium]
MRSSWVVAIGVVIAVVIAFASDEPMTNQRVVQMLLTGTPVADVVAEIRSRPAAFDLSDEMVAELRTAGIPDAVIAAMRERQREQDGPDEEETEAEVEATAANLVVAFEPGVFVFPGFLPEPVAQALEVRITDTLPEVTDAALFLACRTAIHVPDQWRSKTPLGRDFVSMPRHELLAFVPGAREATEEEGGEEIPRLWGAVGGDGDLPATLAIDLPEQIEVFVAPGEEHVLVLGLAIQVGNRYLRIDSAEAVVTVPFEETTRFTARIGDDLMAAEGESIVELVEDEAP